MSDPVFSPAALAATLTPAQRRALALLRGDGWATTVRSRLDQRSCRVLAGLGLVTARAHETEWRLTPLGEQVKRCA